MIYQGYRKVVPDNGHVVLPSSFQLALASQLTRSPDITAVAGQHVHIVQPIRVLSGKLAIFGEGNLISNQTSACCPAAAQNGMIVLLTITADSRGARVTFIRYVPIWVRHPDFVVLPAGTAWRTDPADAAALRASYERTVAAAGRGPRIQPVPAHLLSAGSAGRAGFTSSPPHSPQLTLRSITTKMRQSR